MLVNEGWIVYALVTEKIRSLTKPLIIRMFRENINNSAKSQFIPPELYLVFLRSDMEVGASKCKS